MAQPPIANDSQGADTSPVAGEARLSVAEEIESAPLPTPTYPPSSRESRVAWLLEQMQGDDPECRPGPLNRLLREKFGIASACATRDIAETNRQIQEAIDGLAPMLGGQVKTALTRIAVKAERAGQFDVASSTWARLGKIGGLEEKSDPSKAAELTPAQLDAKVLGDEATVHVERFLRKGGRGHSKKGSGGSGGAPAG